MYNAREPYLDRLIDTGFQGINRLFVLSLENDVERTAHTGYYLPKAEIKDYNAKIDDRNFLINQ